MRSTLLYNPLGDVKKPYWVLEADITYKCNKDLRNENLNYDFSQQRQTVCDLRCEWQHRTLKKHTQALPALGTARADGIWPAINLRQCKYPYTALQKNHTYKTAVRFSPLM